MRLARFAIALFAISCFAPAFTFAEAPAGQTELAANAALQYWQAFSQLPTLEKEHEKIFAELHTVSFSDPAVEKLIAGSHQGLLFLRRGAALPRCDWGLDYNDGVGLLLLHLAKARDTARLAVLRARHEFERGNFQAARADTTAVMTLGRHVARDPIMISLLVGSGIEGMVVDVVSPYLPELKASHAKALAEFEKLPPAATLQQSIDLEKKYMAQWMIRRLKEEEAKSPGAWRDVWRSLIDGSGAELTESVKKPESVTSLITMLEDLMPVYDELARFVALPYDQFDAQYPAFKQKTKAAQPMAGLLLPAVDKLRQKMQRNDARIAMMLAGIAVVESGPEKLRELKSPFGPFEYRALDQGFELKSKLLFEGQPVTLTIGKK